MWPSTVNVTYERRHSSASETRAPSLHHSGGFSKRKFTTPGWQDDSPCWEPLTLTATRFAAFTIFSLVDVHALRSLWPRLCPTCL